MRMALDPGQVRLATRLGQGALLAAAALTAGVFALPTAEPPAPPTSAATDAQISSAQHQVDEAIAEARAAATKALVQPEDWRTLAATLTKVRPPEKPRQPQVADAAEAEQEAEREPEPQPTGPRPAQTNSILATWRYIGPITVGEQKFAILTIRGKQVLMGIGEESQAFRLLDVAPNKLLVQHTDGSRYEVALASPEAGAQPGSLPVVAPPTGARPPARSGGRSIRDMTVQSRDGSSGGGQR